MTKRPKELDDADRGGVFALHVDMRMPNGEWAEVPVRSVADLVIWKPEMIGVVQTVACGDAGIREFRLRYDGPLE